jgi:hypothetical protein
MKTFNEFLTESRKFKTKEEFLKYSNNNWSSNDSLERILNGQDSYAFHGSNRDFDNFDMSFLREWRAEMFLGKGIFLTPSREIAQEYSDANANSDLPLKILDDAKKIDSELGDFMSSLYYKGNSSWEEPKFRKWLDLYYKQKDVWKFGDVDPNDMAELVNLIPNSQSAKDYDEDRYKGWDNLTFSNIFSNSHQALSVHQIKDLKKLGLGDYYPKIFTVYIKGTNSVLLSNSVNEIKKSKHDIIIAYNVPNLVDDVPEIIVKNISLLKIIDKKHYWDEEDDE